MLTVTTNQFWKNKTWEKPIPQYRPGTFKNGQWVELFDQNGYRLTHLEQEYSVANEQRFVSQSRSPVLQSFSTITFPFK